MFPLSPPNNTINKCSGGTHTLLITTELLTACTTEEDWTVRAPQQNWSETQELVKFICQTESTFVIVVLAGARTCYKINKPSCRDTLRGVGMDLRRIFCSIHAIQCTWRILSQQTCHLFSLSWLVATCWNIRTFNLMMTWSNQGRGEYEGWVRLPHQ